MHRAERAVCAQDERIREAARTGNVELIESWPAGDAAVNKPGQGGWCALHFAAREGRKDVVTALLSKGADATKRTTKGERPIHCACEKGHEEAVAILLDAPGADVNAPGPYKATPLHVASTPAVAELLLSRGADPALKYRGRTPATHHFEKGNGATSRAIQKFDPTAFKAQADKLAAALAKAEADEAKRKAEEEEAAAAAARAKAEAVLSDTAKKPTGGLHWQSSAGSPNSHARAAADEAEELESDSEEIEDEIVVEPEPEPEPKKQSPPKKLAPLGGGLAPLKPGGTSGAGLAALAVSSQHNTHLLI